MANFYKNAFYDPSTTAAVTTYTCPSNANAIIQNVQITNESGNKTVKVRVTDSSATTSFIVAYADITGPTICNVAKGPIILEESDSISIESSTTSAITATLAILELSREDQNG
jgi:polyisoprenoid-binding protein YceI